VLATINMSVWSPHYSYTREGTAEIHEKV